MSLWSKPINLRASKSSPFCPRSPTSSVHSEISTEWARQNEVHGSSLNGTVTGKKPPTRDILRALSLRKVFAYERM